MDDADRTLLTPHDIEAADLADWRPLFSTLEARFATGDFATGLALVDRIGAAAEDANHHPDVVLSYPQVVVRLSSHDVGGLTRRDVALARTISGYAAEAGVSASVDALSAVEVAIDTTDRDRIAPFWAAVLGYPAPDPGAQELVDPAGLLQTIWFQTAEPHDTPRQRFHYDVRVPPEQAQARIDAALAAGGTMDSVAAAPAFWVLADGDGNKACVTTWQGRG